MSGCQKCIFYDKEMDDLYRSGEDEIIEGKPQRDCHYCLEFRELYKGIPQEYWDRTKNCPYFEAKKDIKNRTERTER